MTDLLAHANYSNGSNYNYLEQRKITGWIPAFGMYKPEIEGFPYNKEKDEYRCPMNKPFLFKDFIQACPMKSTCAPNIHCRKITRTIYDEQYLRAYSRQNSKEASK